MPITEIRTTVEVKMDQSIVAFKNNLSKIRTGRANPALLDSVHVDYYGAMLPISQVANVSLLDARTISVQPWEKGMGPKIEKRFATVIWDSILRPWVICCVFRCLRCRKNVARN